MNLLKTARAIERRRLLATAVIGVLSVCVMACGESADDAPSPVTVGDQSPTTLGTNSTVGSGDDDQDDGGGDDGGQTTTSLAGTQPTNGDDDRDDGGQDNVDDQGDDDQGGDDDQDDGG